MTTSRVGPRATRARPARSRSRAVRLARGVAIVSAVASQGNESGTRYAPPDASAEATQSCRVFGSLPSRTIAIWFPSGDQSAASTSVAVISLRIPVPSAFTIHSSLRAILDAG